MIPKGPLVSEIRFREKRLGSDLRILDPGVIRLGSAVNGTKLSQI